MDNKTELIEKYIKRQFTPEEEKAFWQRVHEDEELRRMLEDAAMEIDEIDDQGIIEDEGSDDLPGSDFSIIKKVLIAVACVAVIAVVVAKNVDFKKVVLPADEEAMTEQYVNAAVVSGDAIDLNRMFKKVEAGEDLPGTIDSLKIALNDFRSNNVHASIETKLYLAKAYYKQNDYASAMPLLQEVIASGDPEYTGEAQLLYYKIHNKV